MSVKIAVLGLIVERRGYGYDLLRRFEDRFGPWKVNQSTVYDAIDKLYREERIVALGVSGTAARQAGPTRSPKIVYEATPSGREDFLTWLTAPIARVDPVRSEVLLKIALCTQEHALPLLRVLDAHIDACTDALAQLLAAYQLDALGAREVPWSVASGYYVTDSAVTRLQGDLAWLRRVRAGVEALRAHGAVPLSALMPVASTPPGWR